MRFYPLFTGVGFSGALRLCGANPVTYTSLGAETRLKPQTVSIRGSTRVCKLQDLMTAIASILVHITTSV